MKTSLMVLSLVLLPLWALGLSVFFKAGNESHARNGDCDDLVRLADSAPLVAGYFVNADDVRFYRGSASQLSDYLISYTTLRDITTGPVVLHRGKGEITYANMDLKKEYGIDDRSCDWKLEVENSRWRAAMAGGNDEPPTTYTATVHVYSGGLKWQDVKLPPGLQVVGAD
jgi:hypothetical protein